MDTMAAIKQTFFQECEEQLAELGGLMRAHRRLTIDLPAGL